MCHQYKYGCLSTTTGAEYVVAYPLTDGISYAGVDINMTGLDDI